MEITKQQKPRRFTVIFFLLSAIALLSQVMFLRQALLLFEQSEYIISIFLFLWLAANGIGVYAGSKHNNGVLQTLSAVQWYALVVLICYYGLYFLRPLLLTIKTPETLLPGFLLAALCIVLPSFFNGWIFALFVRHGRRYNKTVVFYYKIEALAFIMGGLASTIVVFYFSDFWILAGGILLLQVLILWSKYSILRLLPGVLAFILILVNYYVQKTVNQQLLPDYEYVETTQTPSGEFDIMQSSDGGDTLRLFQGAPVNSIKPPAAPEEATFPAFSQRQNKPAILLAGSDKLPLLEGLTLTKFRSVDILITDPRYFEIIKAGFPLHVKKWLQQKRVKVVHSTLQKYLQESKKKYDIIYLNEKKPALMENALLYFPHNLKIMQAGLKPNGVLCLLFSSEAAYSGRVNLAMKGSVNRALNQTFSHTNILALDNYTEVLASQKPLIKDFKTMEQNLQKSGAELQYFSAFNIENRLMNAKQIGVNEMKGYTTPLSFNKPVIYLAGLLKMIEHYNVNTATSLMDTAQKIYAKHSYWQIGGLIFITILFLIFIRRQPFTGNVFQAGFVGISAQILFMYLYQLHFGQIYLLIGILVALFMAGLTGGLITPLRKYIRWIPVLCLVLIVGLLVSLFFLRMQWTSFVGMLLAGYYTGVVFMLSNTLSEDKGQKSGLNYYISDLAGSVAGNLIIPLLFIPLLGFYASVILIALLGFLSMFIFLNR